MRSLLESILNSTNSGRGAYIKRLILNPYNRIEELNKVWKSFELSLEFGNGDGKWRKGATKKSLVYEIEVLVNDRLQTVPIALLTDSNISIFKDIRIKADILFAWAQKIEKSLNMCITTNDNNFINLDFCK